MENKKIVVVGSSNMDMVVKTEHIPVPGETVLSGSFFMNPGGKGANQAVTGHKGFRDSLRCLMSILKN